jgi:hypothetical protein
MPRALWPLLHGRPSIRVVLTLTVGGQPTPRHLVADTGAGNKLSRFELILAESDCLLCGRASGKRAGLGGAYAGSFPIYSLRVQVPELGFNGDVAVVGVPTTPVGFDSIAGFRFLNCFTYGNFGDPGQFGLET